MSFAILHINVMLTYDDEFSGLLTVPLLVSRVSLSHIHRIPRSPGLYYRSVISI